MALRSPSLFSHALFRFLFILLLLLAKDVTAGPSNRTIDDQDGDEVTGVKPVFTAGWHTGQNCTVCRATLDPSQTFENTWLDTTVDADGVENITLSFTGTHLVSSSRRILKRAACRHGHLRLCDSAEHEPPGGHGDAHQRVLPGRRRAGADVYPPAEPELRLHLQQQRVCARRARKHHAYTRDLAERRHETLHVPVRLRGLHVCISPPSGHALC
jgi:hypothetical protein